MHSPKKIKNLKKFIEEQKMKEKKDKEQKFLISLISQDQRIKNPVNKILSIKKKIQISTLQKNQFFIKDIENLQKSFEKDKKQKPFREFLINMKAFIATKYYQKNYSTIYKEISEKAIFLKNFKEYEKYFKFVTSSIKIFYILCKCKNCADCNCKIRKNVENEKKCENCKSCVLENKFPRDQKKKITSAKRFIFNIIRNNLKRKLIQKNMKNKIPSLPNKNILFLIHFFELDFSLVSRFKLKDKSILKINLKKHFCKDIIKSGKNLSFWQIYDDFYGKFLKNNQLFYLKNFKLYRDEFVPEFYNVKKIIFQKVYLFFEENNNLGLENLKNFMMNIFRISEMEDFIKEI